MADSRLAGYKSSNNQLIVKSTHRNSTIAPTGALGLPIRSTGSTGKPGPLVGDEDRHNRVSGIKCIRKVLVIGTKEVGLGYRIVEHAWRRLLAVVSVKPAHLSEITKAYHINRTKRLWAASRSQHPSSAT